jgi:hypothetical protein
MRSTIEMAREASVVPYIVGPTNTEYLERIERLVELARADEREASIDAVLQIIKELRPALVLAAFADKDNAWVLDKVKESIEKLKEAK